MRSNSIGRQTITRAMLAGSILLFATIVAPALALFLACSMPCCDPTSAGLATSVAAGGCAQECGFRDADSGPRALPDAVAATSVQAAFGFSAIFPAAFDELVPQASSSLAELSVDAHHAVPGDAPLYLFNSLFLI